MFVWVSVTLNLSKLLELLDCRMTFYDGEEVGGKKKHHCQDANSNILNMFPYFSATTLKWYKRVSSDFSDFRVDLQENMPDGIQEF